MARQTKAQLQEILEETQAALSMATVTNMRLKEDITANDIFGSNQWILNGATADPTLINGSTIRRIIIRSRMAALLSPVIVAGLKVLKLFVFGQGVSISSKDDSVDLFVQSFLKRNQKAFFGQRVRMRRVEELHRDGSLYVRFFCNQAGDTDLRVVDALEIQDIYTNPEDKEEVWFYLRNYIDGKGKAVTVAYPDVAIVGKSPAERKEAERLAKDFWLLVHKVDWETPVYRIIVNPIGKWGVTSYLAGMNWAKEYERFLEHRATLYAAYAIFATVLKEKIDRVKQARDSFNADGKSPVKGSMATMSNEGSLETLNTRNATTPPAEGLQFLEMVMMTFGFPPHMFGKEESSGFGVDGRHKFFGLAIESERTSWAEDIEAIIRYAMECKSERGNTIDTDNLQLVTAYPSLTAKETEQVLNSIIDATTLKGQKPAGHISPKQFIQLAAPQLGIEDATAIVDATPEAWPVDEAEAVEFVKSISEALSAQ